MGIRDDFKLYMDGNGFPTPNPQSTPSQRGSDNGPMFLSEYMVMLKKNGQLLDSDKQYFQDKIQSCTSDDLLNRAPIPQDTDLEGPDDLYAVLNASKQLGNVKIPRQLLWGAIKHFGALNNTNPKKWTFQSFEVRQPQLVASMIAASFPSKWNPLHYLIRILCFPLFVYTAGAIAISCFRTPTNQCDPRRLAWHLVQTVKGISVLCWLASQIWYERLYNDYGKSGMRMVASQYYSPKPFNPYSKWWITE